MLTSIYALQLHEKKLLLCQNRYKQTYIYMNITDIIHELFGR